MRALTKSEIKTLASRPDVRRIAVENVLSQLSATMNEFEWHMNFERDCQLYPNWKGATIKAMRDGIKLARGY